MKQEPLTKEQVDLIVDHNIKLIAASEKTELAYRNLPDDKKDDRVRGLISYHRNVAAGLRWSNSIANQRLKKEKTDERPAVQ